MVVDSANQAMPHQPDNIFLDLPVRARVAMVLCVLQRLSSLLDCDEALARQVHSAISRGWNWEMGGLVSGHALYQPLDGLNESLSGMYSEEKLRRSDPQLLAMLATVYGLYYVCWEAVNQEVSEHGMTHFLEYPNDLADVTDEHLLKCLECGATALRNMPKEIEWQRSLALRFSAKCRETKGHLGPVIRPDECADCLDFPPAF